MIIGIGNDLVDIRRIDHMIERHGTRFLKRCFTPFEREKADRASNRAAYFAKRFAAKEALVKALGTGIAGGVFWTDMCVENDENGKPFMTLGGKAADILNEKMPSDHQAAIHLSLSDDFPYAQSFLIIEAVPIVP